jgi:ABC-2 type transport system permease protein
MRQITLVAGNELRLMGADPTPVVMLLVLPVCAVLLFSDGFVGGASRAIPGLSLLFGLVGVTAIGLAFFRDHGWGTWDRFRASPLNHGELIAAKVLPLGLLFLMQQVSLLAAGRFVLGMPWHGSAGAAALLVLALVATEVALGLCLTAFCHTINQVNAVGTLAGVLLAGISGALAPLDQFPNAVQAIAHALPPYWALDGFHRLIITGDGIGTNIAVLVSFAAALTAIALWRMRFDEPKRFYA